ncbi:MAG: glycosyltransferase [Rhodoglobus sp.]
MHIAHVTSFYSAQALRPSSAVRARGIAYRAAGHEFTVIVPGTAPAVDWTEYATVITVPARGAALRRGFVPIPVAICRALDRLVPDRLEVADRLSFRQLAMWANDNMIPAVLFGDEITTEWATERALARYQAVVGTVAGAASRAATALGVDAVNIPDGVDLEIFSPLRHNSTLRDSSGADLIVICAAPLTAGGSVSTAIDAVRNLSDRGVDVHLVVLGDGPLKSRLERSAHGLSVQFLSPTGMSLIDRSEIFATADCALVTVGGSSGRAVSLEALASGTPTVVSAAQDHSIAIIRGAAITTALDAGQAADALLGVATQSVESRRRAARETALPWDAMPLARAMLTLHDSFDDTAAAPNPRDGA